MKTSLNINKRPTSSAVTTVIAASLLLAGPAFAANPTPHPGRAGADTESITKATWITNPTWRNAETRGIIHPSFLVNPDSKKPAETRAIIHRNY